MSFPRTEPTPTRPQYKTSTPSLGGNEPSSINTPPPPPSNPQQTLPGETAPLEGGWSNTDTFERGPNVIAQGRTPSNGGTSGASGVSGATGGNTREQIVNDLLGNLKGRDRLKAKSATDSFSDDQLKQMRDAGVKMTIDRTVPANRQLAGGNSSKPLANSDVHARYLPESRTLQIPPPKRS